MAINYKFNQWRESGEATTEITERGYKLLRSGHGFFSGQTIGYILYKHYILGESANVLCREFKQVPHQTVKAVIRGSFSPEAFNRFFDLVENEPEQLDKLFKGEILNV
ncbi:hypothetical protein [Paraliobacillus ryukyuensis]|uniref:hypothetical protein n=1 Tax=Paraliobacillus ryukyuensis TaxID=200904 RepID=UPI0009A7C402|nr:hypothetical protein [Paraliobacillus ryukyuensis]